ncbi:MAG: Nitrogen fixation protein FixI [Pseudomonadota bacterium]
MTAAPVCRHCGAPLAGAKAGEGEFCCAGCAAAHALIGAAGLDSYYRRARTAGTLAPRPESGLPEEDLSDAVRDQGDGTASLTLLAEGVTCGACVWLIESLLVRQPGVVAARVNLTTRRLTLRFRPAETSPTPLLAPVRAVGYRLVPFDPDQLDQADRRHLRGLLTALAVTGFAAGNVMLLSVSVWAGAAQGMGPATRDLLHWLSALVALPAIAFGLRPFAASAGRALRAGHTNMDVPITLGVVLTTAMSLVETIGGGPHAYFDSAVSLLFFLLIGRTLDARARGRARAAVADLLRLEARAVLVLDPDGGRRLVAPGRVRVGETVLVAAGERIGIDGTVTEGVSDLDESRLTGESLPVPVGPGRAVQAGSLNLTAPLRLTVSAVGDATVLAEIVRLTEAAEQGRARHVALAERVARWYAPVVHLAALATFAGWTLLGGLDWQPALLIAVSVLIVTCPCALALAVPAVQVIAAGRLLRRGILIKSATALERLAAADHAVFDKTGTLTEGQPRLIESDGWSDDDRAAAAALAAGSTHPLARAFPAAPPAAGLREVAGQGIEAADGSRLGQRGFVGLSPEPNRGDAPDPLFFQKEQRSGGASLQAGRGAAAPPGPEVWLTRPGHPPVRFRFVDPPRADAAATLARLRQMGFGLELLSGDRPSVAGPLAAQLGIDDWRAGQTPAAKGTRLDELSRAGKRVLMVGDGINDAPALAAALVSIAPARGADIARAAADLVFQGGRLDAVAEAVGVARAARRLVAQNLAFALAYNLLAVPVAVSGQLTPLFAAIAMSASSLLVILNALRLSGGRR